MCLHLLVHLSVCQRCFPDISDAIFRYLGSVTHPPSLHSGIYNITMTSALVSRFYRNKQGDMFVSVSSRGPLHQSWGVTCLLFPFAILAQEFFESKASRKGSCSDKLYLRSSYSLTFSYINLTVFPWAATLVFNLQRVGTFSHMQSHVCAHPLCSGTFPAWGHVSSDEYTWKSVQPISYHKTL